MTQVPKRVSLGRLTADAIRKDIRQGKWAGGLPGERALSDLLQVSRRTIKDAIRLLRKEGTITSQERHRHQVLQKTSRQRKSAAGSGLKTVNFLFGEDFRTMKTFEFLFCIDEIRRHLQDAGYHLEVISAKGLEFRQPEKLLTQLVERKPAKAWLLWSPPVAVQHWFSAQGLPVLLSGTPDSNVKLPALDMDYHAVGRHAAASLLALGHRRLGYLLSQAAHPGDLAVKAGLEEAVGKHPDASAIEVATAYYAKGSAALCWEVDQLLKKNNCTALLVMEALYALTTTSYLMRKGVRIPEEISVITFDSCDSLDFFVPDVTRYDCNVPLFARKLTRMVIQLCSTGTLPQRSIRIIPEFRHGATLAKALVRQGNVR